MGSGVAAGQSLGFAERKLRVRKWQQIDRRVEVGRDRIPPIVGTNPDSHRPEQFDIPIESALVKSEPAQEHRPGHGATGQQPNKPVKAGNSGGRNRIRTPPRSLTR
jgi:hypothetical protein